MGLTAPQKPGEPAAAFTFRGFVRVGEGAHGFRLAQKSAEHGPVGVFNAQGEKVIRSVGEIVLHLPIMTLVASNIQVRIAYRGGGIFTINEGAHFRGPFPEVPFNAADPGIRITQGENEFRAWKGRIHFPVQHRPGIVLKGIKALRHVLRPRGEGVARDRGGQALHLRLPVRIIHAVAERPQRLAERRGAGFMKADDEDFPHDGVHPSGPGTRNQVKTLCRRNEPAKTWVMRILQVDNMQWRHYGRVRVSPERTLFNGLIRAGFKVEVFSDRDVAQFAAPLRIKPLGRAAANKRLLEMVENFRPDMLLVGHADIIRNETLNAARSIVPGLRIALRNVDPLFDEGNVEKIKSRMGAVDAMFITTGGEPLKQFVAPGAPVAFIPNPTDPSVEDGDQSQKDDFDWDLLFCGVGNVTDTRYAMVGALHEKLKGSGVRFASFGMHGFDPIWGRAYEDALEASRMGLSANRYEGWPLYSSDRIAQMMGNGLLTFVSAESGLQRFLGDDACVFWNSADDIAEAAKAFNADDARRKAVAARGRTLYRQLFNAERIGRFMVETTMGEAHSEAYEWADEIYRA